MAIKTLLVTGGCGFIGSNFVRYVLAQHKDIRVINFDALTYAGNPDNLDDVKAPRYEFVRGDITSGADVAAVMKKAQLVVHFAAESHVDRSIEGPEVFSRTNTLGTQILLDHARANSVERFVHVSTDEVYGSLGKEGYFTEESALAPNSPYSASKAGSDLSGPRLLSHFRISWHYYALFQQLRPISVSGEAYSVDDFSCARKQALPVYGDGMNVRDWLYVTDHCRAIDAVCSGASGRGL